MERKKKERDGERRTLIVQTLDFYVLFDALAKPNVYIVEYKACIGLLGRFGCVYRNQRAQGPSLIVITFFQSKGINCF